MNSNFKTIMKKFHTHIRVVFESFNLFLGMDVDIKNFNIILRACTERGTVLQSTALLIHNSLRFFFAFVFKSTVIRLFSRGSLDERVTSLTP